ncbi:IS1380-family transposase [Octadecabacter antarcticus 307]|uniref:IS1380-family transposase n=1 Tax=Octadecabacter antarcticus 307 TaxID=391626 RepID=M9R9S3_9RHOB|nr:IS1380-like element ISOan2 family transposase [Octadecabacter antarcticus]AGI68558.1 IS1380-family transposase [Octadecabacter antarcticus 307]
MDHPEGARETGYGRLGFDRRVRLEFRGTQLSSDGGLLVMRELDDALGLSNLASGALNDTRRGKNRVHRLDGLFRQSVYGRLAGYEDVNDADRLAFDPVMRQVVGGRAVDAQAASASQMGRFETETLALPENRAALADLNGTWIDRFHDRNGLKYITLDMDSSVSPTHGDQEGTAWNGHFDCTCYHPNFLFNQFGMLERCALRNGNVHSADGWRDVLDPVIARYAGRKLGGRFFRADAAYAMPAIYERLEEAGYFYAIRLPTNAVLKEKIAHPLTRPVGRPSLTKVKRIYEDIEYQAQSWDKPRRVIAKIEWHPGELFPKVGFIVTNMPMDPDWVVRFYNQRGTAEQHIKEGKYAFRWTRLSCKRFRDNEVRLQLHALAYNLATFLRCIELPAAMANWSLTSLQLKLIKMGARVVRHARAITFQLAEVAVTGPMVRAIFTVIHHLRAPPSCA